jgi:diaminopimelate epimerase
VKPQRIAFTKMQGAGNDFVVIDATARRLELTREQWRWLADRRFGVGADQILVVESPAPGDEGVDFVYRIFNADGGEVEQCGNGARCFARFVHDKKLSGKDTIRVQTKSGVIAPRLTPDGRVTVDMGRPVLEPAQVPFDTSGLTPVAQGSGQMASNAGW